MIGYISGQILEITEHTILILPQGGIGYEIHIHERLFAHLAGKHETSLYLYHHITEGGQTLFGFETLEEKHLFTQLIKISGIGGKVALQILSLGKDRLIEAIQNDDKKTIESIKGIGKKMAEKIVLELKDKDFVTTYIGVPSISQSARKHDGLEDSTLQNITSTLQNMGYQARDIQRVISELPEDLRSVEEILPYMIRELS